MEGCGSTSSPYPSSGLPNRNRSTIHRHQDSARSRFTARIHLFIRTQLSHRARVSTHRRVPQWALQLFGSPTLLLRRAGRAPGGYCRCTRNGGASVHLLEDPVAAHLHRHDKIFIDTTKCSASPRPSRRGVPRGGTRQDPRGIGISPRGAAALHPGQLRKLRHQGTNSRQGGDVAYSYPSGSPPPEGRRV